MMSRSSFQSVLSVALVSTVIVFEAARAHHIPGKTHHQINPVVVANPLQPKNNHSLHYGEHKPNEFLLYQVVLSSANEDNDMQFPQEDEINETKISSIEIIDKMANGQCGFVYHYGGVGHKDVLFHYFDREERPYNFAISVYGVNE